MIEVKLSFTNLDRIYVVFIFDNSRSSNKNNNNKYSVYYYQ